MYPLARLLPVESLSPDRHPPVSSDEVYLCGRVVIHQGQGWPTTLNPAFAHSGSVHLRIAIGA